MTGIRCMLMRGGTSKGAYFLAADLPADPGTRDELLLRVMGSPDPRQIDGIGGGHPLTSKVAVISPGDGVTADIDYLFLQVGVDTPVVNDAQTCGNLLAGVGPFAVDRGLADLKTPVRIRMVNTGEIATATRGADPSEVVLGFASGGPLLPTGNVRDQFGGVSVTCVNAGMPVVVAEAAAFGLTGREPVASLEADAGLLDRITALRLAAGPAMGLGDVTATTVPKVCLIASPHAGGVVSTRTFIPVRVHEAIGVLGAVSVAAALLIDGAVGNRPDITGPRLLIEHPSGVMAVEAEVDTTTDPPVLVRSGVVRTARKLFDGTVFPRR
jgi:4-oxalomesaconate tautomerase